MAYGIKYKFVFQSVHGVIHTVNILKNGYSGSVTQRPLGKAPVLHMKDGDPFRATSCDLSLECHVDGEFAEFYTCDPFDYRVDVFRGGTGSGGGTQIWTGFLTTEIYSEPNIAPPYDVGVTATDGLGTLKEYDFEEIGLQPLGSHMKNILKKTGLDLQIDWVSKISATGGTVPNFIDAVAIDLDYLAGKNCYEALEEILTSLHATITQYNGRWLVIRETDMTVASSGNIAVYRTPTRSGSGSTSATTITGGRKTVGQMGVADMWPVGYTTRKAVPAKRRITVEAPWHTANAAASVEDDGWSIGQYASFVQSGGDKRYTITGSTSGSSETYGYIYCQKTIARFTKSMNLTIRAAAPSDTGKLTVNAMLTVGPTNYYFFGGKWHTEPVSFDADMTPQTVDVVTYRASEAAEFSFNIPAHGDTTIGLLTVYVGGVNVCVFDVDLRPVVNQGYRDDIVIDNGARGDGDTASITGGRMTSDDFDLPAAYQGIWRESTSSTSYPVYLFTDNNFASKDWMSIQALGRALSVAVPRIEIHGVLDFPTAMTLQPVVLRDNSVNYLVTAFDWDLYNEEMTVTAISLPSATMTVASETVTSLGNADVRGTGGSSSGGGGTVTETDPVFSASAAAGISSSDITNWNGKATASWGGTSGGMTQLTVNGTQKKVLTEGWSELPSVSSSDNGKVLKVVSGAWAKGTDSGYTKPSGGIPSSDMTSAVQTSLGKADSALQAVPSDYKKVVLLASESDMPASPDSDTLYLIPET